MNAMADIDTGKARSNVQSALDILSNIGSDILELDGQEADIERINTEFINLRTLLTSALTNLGGTPE